MTRHRFIMMRSIGRGVHLILIAILILTIWPTGGLVSAQTAPISQTGRNYCQRNNIADVNQCIRTLRNQDILYVDPIEKAACRTNDSSGTGLVSGKVYMLGDSITAGAKANLEKSIPAAGFTVASINADGGRAISYDSFGSEPTGLQAVETDKSIIAGADIVVVALGTNSGNEDLNVQIPALIQSIKASGTKAVILWANTFYGNPSSTTRNKIISDLSAAQGYKVIDTTATVIELGPDKIHPTAKGSATFAEVIANGIKAGAGGSSQAGSAGTFDPLSLRFPAFPDKAGLATKMTDYIKETEPSSPWLKINSDIGGWLMAESESRDINPLLILTIGKQENGFGTYPSKHVTQYHNYFGMKGTTPIDIPGSDYRGFSSPLEGMTFFLDKVKQNTQGSDRGYYKDVKNFYEYQGMHQAGSITYPGESLGPHNGGQDGYDPSMDVFISWTRSDHPNNRYDGQLFNPGIYFKNSVNLINKLTGLNLSLIPSRTTSPVGVGCTPPGENGSVGINGYKFPLAPQTKRVSGLPCQNLSVGCHSDPSVPGGRTGAFDLFSVQSAAVYAIYSGTPTNIVTDFNSVAGCSSIQLKADDGFYYWYGHLKNVVVSEGVPIAAGTKMAEVADSSYGSECVGGGPHLHIDRGCTIDNAPQPGGRDACRDPAFVALMNDLYASLPDF